MHWREYVDFRASGRNPYAFVNAVRKSPVACGEQRCTGDTFSGRILRRDLPALRELAGAYHMELTVSECRSAMGKLRRFRLRLGLVIGLLLGITLIFWQSNVVETIEIEGASRVDERVILSLLEEEGVHRGTWIADIDMLTCEYRLCTSVPDIAWAGMRRTGNRLVVQISETREKPEMLRERIPCNIVAAYDAQITDITVRSGKPCRRAGDGVAKGELLVSGVRTDEYGKTTFLHANAAVTGIYTREAELTAYFARSETTPTGNAAVRRTLRIFGLYLPLTPQPRAFAESRTRTSEVPLEFLGFRLPCAICSERCEELQTHVTLLTEEAARLALHTDIVRFEKNLLSDVTICARRIDYEITDAGITAHLTYELEGEIGRTAEIYQMP